MAVGKRIKELRERADLTLEEVGKKLGVSKQTMYKYETGLITNIPSDKIETLAGIFGVDPSYLMGWEDLYTEPDDRTSRSPEVLYVMDRMTKADENKQEQIVKLVNLILGEEDGEYN